MGAATHGRVLTFPEDDETFRGDVARAISDAGVVPDGVVDIDYLNRLESMVRQKHPKADVIGYMEGWLPCVHVYRDGAVRPSS